MVQIWEIDDKNYYTGKMDFVEKPTKLQITKPLLIGFIKPFWDGSDWEEGATKEEIAEWGEQNQIDICDKDRVKTNEELTEEQMKMQKIIADLEIDILNKG